MGEQSRSWKNAVAMVDYLLFESASGFALFQRTESEDVGKKLEEVQQATQDLKRFGKTVKLMSFLPFKSAENALECQNASSEGLLHDYLSNFVSTTLPTAKSGKKSKFVLGVSEPKVGNAIQESLGVKCVCDDLSNELLRGIRLHFHTFIDGLESTDLGRAQLGLAHSYSRSRVKFDVNRADKHIIQSIAILDQMDKDLNTFAMRVREWYSWHFPELVKIVNDNIIFAKLAKFIGNKKTLTDDSIDSLKEILGEEHEEKAQAVLDAARSSMGVDISTFDLHNIISFVDRVVDLAAYRKSLHEYLSSKMSKVAPNLSSLIGEMVGARLISHAGSLTNLAKYPASTVQILGAEKALFRALKTKGNTPKYGLIFHSTFIGRASTKNKGRISRYLANKASMASRIDSFSELPSDQYGKHMRDQVEERLAFYTDGKAPRKNIDVMRAVKKQLEEEEGAGGAADEGEEKKKKKKKEKKEKRKRDDDDEEEAAEEAEPEKKKKKKAKAEEGSDDEEPKKKKKKKKKDE